MPPYLENEDGGMKGSIRKEGMLVWVSGWFLYLHVMLVFTLRCFASFDSILGTGYG